MTTVRKPDDERADADLRQLAREIQASRPLAGRQEDAPSLEAFWRDLTLVLGQVVFSGMSPALVRGTWVSAYVGVTERGKDHLDAILTLYPYNQRWSLVRGVDITMVGTAPQGKPFPPSTVRTGWEGGVTFAELQVGEYQLFATTDAERVTRIATAKLLKELSVEDIRNDLQRSNALVAIRVERTEVVRGNSAVRVFLRPSIAETSLAGFPVIIANRDLGEPWIAMTTATNGGEWCAEFPRLTLGGYRTTELQHIQPESFTFPASLPLQFSVPTDYVVGHADDGARAGIEAPLAIHAGPGLQGRLIFHADDDSYYLHVRGEPRTTTSSILHVGYVVRDTDGRVAMFGNDTERVELTGKMLLTQQSDGSWYGEDFFLGREEIREFASNYAVFVGVQDGEGV